jgi:hypothetical protein
MHFLAIIIIAIAASRVQAAPARFVCFDWAPDGNGQQLVDLSGMSPGQGSTTNGAPAASGTSATLPAASIPSSLSGSVSSSAPLPQGTTNVTTPPTAGSPLVFAHYMLITRPPNGDYSQDFTLAKKAGIDAFAVNYGGWNTDFNQQEGYLADFYRAAAGTGVKVFLSIDTTSVTDKAMVLRLANLYSKDESQLYIDGKMLLSSFQTGDPSFKWETEVISELSTPTMLLPGTLSDAAEQVFGLYGEGHLTWLHPRATVEEEAGFDQDYAKQRDATGKKWMAAIASWYFKRFDGGNNWAHAQDDGIFIDRFQNLLKLKPDFIELTTWNDWGESSYYGPSDTTGDLPHSNWDTLDHSGFLSMATYFIAAYKSGQDTVIVDPSNEAIFMFYRTQPAADLPKGSATDSLPLPMDADRLKDQVYIVSFLASEADITLDSGGTKTTIKAGAGVSKMGVPWTFGEQSLEASRNGVSFATKSGGPAIGGVGTYYNGNVVVV